MDGQVVQGRVQAPGGARGGLAHQPPPLGRELAGAVALARLGERAHCPVEQPAGALELVGAVHAASVGYAASSGASAGRPCRAT
jgi:hypothetical protein